MKVKIKGFSIMEVVISVTIIALILSTLGLSFLSVERLRLNAQITSEIQKIGEGLIDHLFTLPISDSYIRRGNSDPNNGIISLADLLSNGNDTQQIITTLDNLLNGFANSYRFRIIDNPNAAFNNRKGAIVRFGNANGNSRVFFNNFNNPNGQIYNISITLVYVSPNGNRRNIRVDRIVIP